MTVSENAKHAPQDVVDRFQEVHKKLIVGEPKQGNYQRGRSIQSDMPQDQRSHEAGPIV
jgi:hypothetical protein